MTATPLARALGDLAAAGIEATSRIPEGRPADVLMAVAEDLDASTIVVGTVGENPISGALLGSVVLKLVQ
jgi:nucleotide-binding universal stress UspA family protein